MARDYSPSRMRSGNLLVRLLGNPQLPAYIKKLDGPELGRLVQHLGKEDAQHLLVHATGQQISELIETDAWERRSPGQSETFNPERFLEWLELWSDMGPAFLARRVRDLGSQLFAHTLATYVVVVDIFEVGVSGWADTFGSYSVMPNEDEYWPLLLRFITELWDEDQALLEEVFGHCCQRRSLTAEKTHITANENLASDVEARRDSHRRESGYVTSDTARAYLNRIAGSSLDKLLVEVDFDPFTAFWLRRQERTIVRSKPQSNEDGFDAGSTASESDRPDNPADPIKVELEGLLNPIVTPDRGADRLLRLVDGRRESESYLDRQLHRLSIESPEAASRCMNELMYLANVLMEGTPSNSDTWSEKLALKGVHATCNLGLEYCVNEIPWDDEASLLAELLEYRPGLIRVFNIGFRLLLDLRNELLQALQEVLISTAMTRKLQEEDWLATEMKWAIDAAARNEIDQVIDARGIDSLADQLLQFCDPETCEQLRVLVSPFPRLPGSLANVSSGSPYVDRSWQFIGHTAQLHTLARWGAGLTPNLMG